MKPIVCPECDQPMLPPGEVKRPNEYDHASGCPLAPSLVAPICDLCGAPATRIASLGANDSRRFKCEAHRFRLPEHGRPENERFRTGMSYDEAQRLLMSRMARKTKNERRMAKRGKTLR
jgi:predicted amidophosphoribosyltransferase